MTNEMALKTLENSREKILDVIEDIKIALRSVGGTTQERAKIYWLAYLESALTKETDDYSERLMFDVEEDMYTMEEAIADLQIEVLSDYNR